MDGLLFRLLQIVYPLELPDKKRDRPLQVLAVGPSRTGTDSLRQALLDLGYHDCYHGFRYLASPNDCLQWIRLGRAHEMRDNNFLNTTEFDRVLGDCAAFTDMGCAVYSHELLRLYPDAKIILNYREDIDAWHQSCLNTIDKSINHKGWYSYLLTFFEPHLFWKERSLFWVWRRHFDGDFERNGKEWYRRHYQNLEQALPAGSYLKWKVQDGWAPLCEFLGKPVPQRPFPAGNVPEEFMKKATQYQLKWTTQAKRNLRMTIVILGSLAVAAAGYLWRTP